MGVVQAFVLGIMVGLTPCLIILGVVLWKAPVDSAFSDDAIVTKDLNGVITSWNKGAERIFGYLAEEVIGKPVTILIPSDRHDEETAILRRIRRGERIDHFDTIRQRKDGALIAISLTISPIKDPRGKIAGASKIARDIISEAPPQTDEACFLEEKPVVGRRQGARI